MISSEEDTLAPPATVIVPVPACPPAVPLAEILREYKEKYKQIFQIYCNLHSSPGKEICMKYMRSGVCGNGMTACRYHHPMDRFGSETATSSSLKVIDLLGNICTLCSNVSPDAKDIMATFLSDLVAVLDKYFQELTAEYGPGCIIYGDSVLKLHEAFNTFRKRVAPNKSKRRKAGSSKHDKRDLDSFSYADQQFEDNCKILLQCLKYLNTRWVEEESLFSSLLQASLAYPVAPQLLPGLEQEIRQLANDAEEQQNVNKERKEAIRTYLLCVANLAINAHVHDTCKQDEATQRNYCVLKPFGSSANTLGSSSSDLDLCLGYEESLDIEPEKLLQSMALLLQEGQDKVTFQVQEGERGKGDDMCFSLVVREVVTATRVPVLKLFDSDSNLEVDICVNNFLALKNTALLRRYSLLQPRFRWLVLAVKHWAKARGIGDPRNATLTSYAWTLLVAFFLINHREKLLPPALELSDEEKEEPATTAAAPTGASAAQLFMEFFSFYGTCGTDEGSFSPFHHIVSIRHRALATGSRLKKSSSLYTSDLLLSADPSHTSSSQLLLRVLTSEDTMQLAPLLDKMLLAEEMKSPIPPPPHAAAFTPLSPPTESSSPLSAAPAVEQKIESSNNENIGKKPQPAPETAAVVTSVLPTWRFTIEDPYEEHDLGRVIFSQTGMMHMMTEMRRVLTLFQEFNTLQREEGGGEGGDFWRSLCEINVDVPKAEKTCMVCGQVGHFSRECFIGQTCHICQQSGHIAKDCTQLKCRKCFQTGHFARNCPSTERLCKICRKPGHIAESCPRNKSGRGSRRVVREESKAAVATAPKLFLHSQVKKNNTSQQGSKQCPSIDHANETTQRQSQQPLRHQDVTKKEQSAKNNKKGRIVEVVPVNGEGVHVGSKEGRVVRGGRGGGRGGQRRGGRGRTGGGGGGGGGREGQGGGRVGGGKGGSIVGREDKASS